MRAQEIVDRALAAASCELAVVVTDSSQVNLRWAVNELTTNGDTVAQQVSVVALDRGTASTSGLVTEPDDVTSLVTRACTAAAAVAPAPDGRPLVAGGTSPDWDDEPDRCSAGILGPLARGLGDAFRQAQSLGDGVEHFGYAEHDLRTVFLGTSAGTRLRYRQPQGRMEFTAKSHGRARSAWTGLADAGMRVDVAAVDDELRRSLARQGRRVDVAAGRHRVILAPSAVADLMIDWYWSSDAQAALDGRSVFAGPDGTTRVGERFGTGVELWSDPAHPGPSMACTPFETAVAASDSSSPYDNGLPLTHTDWVADGVLRHLVTTRYSAEHAGLPVTPGIDNLAMSASGSGSVADVVARTDHGLLVTCLWYNRVVDPQTLLLTGLTRDGVYVVDSGEIVGTSGNFRFNESPVSMLGRIVDAGTEERTLAREMGDSFNRATMPALVVEEFNLSTSSEAL